jgi:hypothetical protein
MVKLITLLVAGIPAIIAAVLASLGRKWVTVAGTIALMVALTGVFVAAINGIVAGLAGAMTAPGWIANSIGMFVPSNFGLVLSSIISAHIARAAYDFAMDKAHVFNAGT